MTELVVGGGGCFNIALACTAEERTQWLIGSVSDDPFDIRTQVVVDRDGPLAYVATELQPVDGVGMAERGYVVLEGERGRGVNEAGVALLWAFVRERDAASSPGLTSGEFTRLVLSTCDSVDAILRILDERPRDFSGAWMFADARGELAQVEIARGRYHVLQRGPAVAGGYAVNANCYQSPEMRPLEDPAGSLDNPQAPNRHRRDAALARVADRGQSTIADLAAALSDHDGIEHPGAEAPWVFPSQGFSVCNHGTYGHGTTPAFGTVSAEILDPMTRTLWYCFGWPCGQREVTPDQPYQDRSWGRFVPFRLDDLPAGRMTTPTGELTPLGVRSVSFEAASVEPGAGSRVA